MRHTFVVAEDDVAGAGPTETPPSRRSSWAPTPARSCSSSTSPATRRAARCRGVRTGRDELLFVVSGAGTLELEGEPHELEPDTAAYVRAGETYVIDNAGPDELRGRLDDGARSSRSTGRRAR